MKVEKKEKQITNEDNVIEHATKLEKEESVCCVKSEDGRCFTFFVLMCFFMPMILISVLI